MSIGGSPLVRLPAARPRLLIALSASLLLTACANSSLEAPSASLAKDTPGAAKSELVKATEYWGKQHAENPRDAKAAVNYVRNLKAMGQKKEALMIMQEAHRHNPTDKSVASEYGRLALEHDQITNAEKLLAVADDANDPDWRVISARGTALAKQGRHTEAVAFFERALQVSPNQASVMNNLAMAHAMEGRADKAESILRKAVEANPSDTRVSQNLALVLGLQGKHSEAGAIVQADETSAAHNRDVVRQMVGVEPPAPAAAPAPSKPAIATAAAPRAPQQAAKPTVADRSTASITPTVLNAKADASRKGKAKAAAEEVDASVLVQRLADGHTGR
jgi:Flp pilus assembly protein TadD